MFNVLNPVVKSFKPSQPGHSQVSLACPEVRGPAVSEAVDDSSTFGPIEHDELWIEAATSEMPPVRATVIVPAYRAEATLRRAVRSALEQTMQDIEVIVVDDASDDRSWDAILELQSLDARVRGIRHKQNRGKPIAMNHAIEWARGRWIAVLDADDWYDRERLDVLIAAGEARGADLVADNQFFFDAGANQLIGTAWTAQSARWRLSFDDFLAGSDAYQTFNFGMLKPVLRGDFIRRSGLAYEEDARNGQDFLYLLQFYLRGGRAVIVDRPLYYYTQPFGRTSQRWSHAQRRRYDFITAHHITEKYLSGAAATITRWQAQRLKRRSRRLRSLEYFFQARERAAAGDLMGAVARVARCPAVFGYLIRRIRGRIAARPGSTAIERVASRARRQLRGRYRAASAAIPH